MRMRYAEKFFYMSPLRDGDLLGGQKSLWGGDKRMAYAVVGAPLGYTKRCQFSGFISDVRVLYFGAGEKLKPGDGIWRDNESELWGYVLAVHTYPRHVEVDVRLNR